MFCNIIFCIIQFVYIHTRIFAINTQTICRNMNMYIYIYYLYIFIYHIISHHIILYPIIYRLYYIILYYILLYHIYISCTHLPIYFLWLWTCCSHLIQRFPSRFSKFKDKGRPCLFRTCCERLRFRAPAQLHFMESYDRARVSAVICRLD